MGTFADRLREVMGDESFTPWAHRHGLSAVTVEGWVNKGRIPYPKTLSRLVEKTGIPADWWLNGEGPPPLLVADEDHRAGGEVGKNPVPGVEMALAYTATPMSAPRAEMTEPRSFYRDETPLATSDGRSVGLKAATITPSVAFATRAILVMQRVDWLPETIDDGVRSTLVSRLFNLLTSEAATNAAMFDRLVESDSAMEAGLRYLWEVERLRHGPESSYCW